MAEAPNRTLRWGVIAVAALAGIGFFIATLRNTNNQSKDAAPAATVPGVSQGPEASKPPAAAPADAKPAEAKPAEPKSPEVAGGPTGQPSALAARVVGDGSAVPASLGSVDGGTLQKVDFSLAGAGVRAVTLSKYFTQIDHAEHVELQSAPVAKDGRVLAPMSLLGVEINGAYVDLFRPGVWKETAPGAFEAVVEDPATKADVAKVVRKYELTGDSYAVRVRQHIENLTAGPLRVRWFQLGPTEMPPEKVTYGGDRRRLKFGYLMDAGSDPSRQVVLANDSALMLDHAQLAGLKDDAGQVRVEMPVWPNAAVKKRGYEMVWMGTVNRYFAALVFPLIDTASARPSKHMAQVESVDRYLMTGQDGMELVPTRLNGTAAEVAAGGRSDFSLAFYVGPQSAQQMAKDPLSRAAGLDQVVFFSFGGPCGCCTFSWLTEPLLKLLIVLHDYVVHDWAVAVMLLVVIVRTLLHPVTKWTQIRMQRFGKQMQSIAPKMQQLKEKYADDQVKLQAETGKLWKEEGISPAGMLGCLTTFIQTPVWLALSAMLFFAIEIRHQHGFYGVFQTMGGPSSAFPFWFLGDLAEPDRLVKFSGPIHIPLLSGMMGPIASFNVLPIFMGVLFYVQQKYISPPQTSATMTPEQEMQMKLMKWMTVFMFPLMMYNAPSGLTLYFFTNSLLGILEGKWIKRHIEKHDLLNMDKLRAGKKPASGWMAKLQERAEKARQMQEEMQRQQQKRGGKDTPDRFGRKR